MKNEVRVMLTCCNIHVKDIMGCFKNNPEGRDVKVYVTNSLEWELPPASECDGRFVVPRLDDPAYIPEMLRICKENKIDAIFPISSIDLDIMAKNKELFEKQGTKVSILDIDTLSIANNKIEMHKRFGDLMPVECEPKNSQDLCDFAENFKGDSYRFGKICSKLANLCGGKGFAVIDDSKCLDPALFHRFGQKHFVSFAQMCNIIDNGSSEVILQEYHEGKDYTVSLVADNGKVVAMAGYVGHLLEFGSIMFGEIKPNENAFKICELLVKELNLDGNIGVDFILKEDGNVVLLEINPRINASLPFVSSAGCNMMYMQLKMLLGESIEGLPTDVKEGFKMKKYFATRYFE